MYRASLMLVIMLSVFLFTAAVGKAENKVIAIPVQTSKAAFQGDLYYTVPFAQFEPAQETFDYLHAWLAASLGTLYLQSGSLGVFNAPVILPDHAVVTQITLSASDHGNSGDITVWLEKVKLDDGQLYFIPDNTGISSSSLAEDATGLISVDVNNEQIDNQNYYYFVYMLASSSPSDYLRAVRIQYHLQ